MTGKPGTGAGADDEEAGSSQPGKSPVDMNPSSQPTDQATTPPAVPRLSATLPWTYHPGADHEHECVTHSLAMAVLNCEEPGIEDEEE